MGANYNLSSVDDLIACGWRHLQMLESSNRVIFQDVKSLRSALLHLELALSDLRFTLNSIAGLS